MVVAVVATIKVNRMHKAGVVAPTCRQVAALVVGAAAGSVAVLAQTIGPKVVPRCIRRAPLETLVNRHQCPGAQRFLPVRISQE